ncbi:hypothetical protein [Novosphingobium colocasiae]|uniref:hypothetical protein n=1 Tax=Novosphingobium colocasiae TaxID=1256513 RepID=UPI0035AFD9D5
MPLNPISAPAGYAPAVAIGFADTSGAFALVNAGAPLPVTTTGGAPLLVSSGVIGPEPWASPDTAWDATGYGDVEVQFVGTPAIAYQPQRSLDGTNFVACLAYDAQGASYAAITAAGIYGFDGNGFLKFATGSGSTLTRRAAA